MAETQKPNGEQAEGSIDYSGSQAQVAKEKAKQAEADRERLAQESE